MSTSWKQIRILKATGFIVVEVMNTTVKSIGVARDKNEIFMSGVISIEDGRSVSIALGLY